MQNRDNDSPAGANSNKLEDEDIIKFAEEVLGDPDDQIIELEDDETLKLDNDEIIDLTEIADKQIQSDDDILDLTEDIEITTDSEDEILELEDVTEESMDVDETLTDLVDSQNDLTLLDDAVLDLDDVVEEITSVEQDIISQEDAVEDEQLTNSTEFRGETDSMELTDADREALESEFDYDAPAENLTAVDDLDMLTTDDVEEEILIDFNDDVTEDAIEEVDLASDLLDEQPDEASSADGPNEKLELTEADRRLLEDELSLEIDGNIENVLGDDELADDGKRAPETVEEEIDGLLNDSLDRDSGEGIDDAGSPTAQVGSHAAEVSLESDTDVEEIVDKVFDPDMAELSPELSEDNNETQTKEEDQGLTDVIDDIDTDGGEPETVAVLETEDLDEEFSFDFDDTAEQTDTDSDDIELPPLTPEEELSVEALLADAQTPEDSGQPSKTGPDDDQPTKGGDAAAKPVVVARSNEEQMTAETDMDFNPTDADDHDLHKVGDPISIRVKEPVTQNHEDEDTLLNSVFKPEPEVEELSSVQLEAAVERAVKKIFAEKIESILFDAIDRAVTKEISRLKTLILGDRDQNA